jgi:large subunit ribosomal protein L16
MLLQPKKTKFKKFKKNYLTHKLETKSYKLEHGFIGLKALESCRITSRQIESVRQCMNRDLKRRGKI